MVEGNLSDYGDLGYSAIGLNVVSWPQSSAGPDGSAETKIMLETLAPIGSERIQYLEPQHFSGLAQQMSFGVEVVDATHLLLTCNYDASMLEPVRIGAASVACRHADENVARLWRIGASPRAHYPEFMRQRRQIVSRLSSGRRRLWLELSLRRAQPLFAALTSRHGAQNAPEFSSWQSGPAGIESVDEMYGSALRSDLGSRPVADDRGRIRALLSRASASAVRGARDDNIDICAYASELVFDALLIVDRLARRESTAGAAATEDRAWFDDCADLMNDDSSSVENCFARHRTTRSAIAKGVHAAFK